MLRFVARRMTMLVVALLASSFVIFAAVYVAPGNPIAVLTGGRQLPAEARQALEHRYHLDDPFLARYWHWLTDALHGDFGVSIVLREDVSSLIGARVSTTAGLVLYASLIILVAGIGLGLLAALRPGAVDTSVLVSTTVLAAAPSFVVAILLISLFAIRLGWLPALGNGTGLLGQLEHLTLPAIALATSALALVARVTRASVRDELEREHVQTAISRALPHRTIIRRHVLRNAAIPITTVVGVTVASLIAVAAVVEEAFNLKGLGSALVSAASSKDFAVVQAISLILVAAFIVVNGLVDVLYALLDPRVKLGSRAA